MPATVDDVGVVCVIKEAVVVSLAGSFARRIAFLESSKQATEAKERINKQLMVKRKDNSGVTCVPTDCQPKTMQYC